MQFIQISIHITRQTKKKATRNLNAFRARNEPRTRDPNLAKVVLCLISDSLTIDFRSDSDI